MPRIGLGCGLGVGGPRVWTPARLPSGRVLRWASGRSLAQFAAGTTAGSGAVSSGGTAGRWADLSATADAFVQGTAGIRPTVKTHTKGRGCAVNGSGEATGGGKYLATASSVTGVKHVYVVATVVGLDTTRSALPAPGVLFVDNFHGFVGGESVVTGSTLLTGNNGTNNFIQHDLSAYTRDGASISIAAADAGYGRRRYVYKVTCGTTMTAGRLTALKSYFAFDGYHARGSLHEIVAVSASTTSGEQAQLQAYLENYWLRGGQILVAGDSLMAGYNVTETQGPGGLLSEAYNRCVSVATIAIPGQGVTSSVSPLTSTMTVDDPAKVLALKGSFSNIIVALAGTNDLYNGRTAVQLLADLTAYVAAAKALGHRVIVGTVAPRSDAPWTAPMETQRTVYNTALRATHAGADGFVDVDAINPARQADGVHWTDVGTAAVVTGAGGVKDACDALLP